MAGTICPSVPVARAGTEVDEEAVVLKERIVLVRGVRSRSMIGVKWIEWKERIEQLWIGRFDKHLSLSIRYTLLLCFVMTLA